MRRSALLDSVGLDPAARADLVGGLRRKRIEDLRVAEDLRRLSDSRHYLAEGCASIGEFGERLGLSASESRMLARAGEAVDLCPSLGEMVLSGQVTLEGAAVLARVLADPAVRGPHPLSRWLQWAREESARRLRNRVRERLEVLRTGSAVHELTIHLTDRGLDDLERSRTLLSDRAKRDVSESETVGVLADYFLAKEDPERVTPGVRRVGDTRGILSRYVPAEAERQVRARSRGCCEVPFCDNTHGLELAHVVPHRDGSGREARDLVRVCHGHHVAYDAGWLEIEMTADGPVFRFHGDPGGRRRGPEPPHLRPNPHADRAARWNFSRPPPEVAAG